jgi:nicotinate dehydrogenase subunit B
VQVILGDTARAPNQGPTIASSSLQLHAQPLRAAAAQARAWLLAQARAAGLPADQLHSDGDTWLAPDGRACRWPAGGRRHAELLLDLATPLQAPADYTVAGQRCRGWISPAKATGAAVYVHDVRRPGMLHGRVVRPPYAGAGRRALRRHQPAGGGPGLDRPPARHRGWWCRAISSASWPSVKTRPNAAMHALRVQWQPHTPTALPLDDMAAALSAHPSTPRVVSEIGDVEAAIDASSQAFVRTYVWPYQLHASMAPAAPWRNGMATARRCGPARRTRMCCAPIWRRLTGLPDTAIDVVRLEASGCYGRNGADDVAADALLLSRAAGRAGARATHAGAGTRLGAQGRRPADDGARRPGRRRHAAGLRLRHQLPEQRRAHAGPAAHRHRAGGGAGLRDGRPHRRCRPMRMPTSVTVHDMAPILRASWLRGVSALPNSFAHECYIDELAHAAGADPVAYRLRHLTDARAASCCAPPPSAPAGSRTPSPAAAGPPRRLAARPGLGLCPLRAQQVPGLRRRLVGLGGRRGGAPGHRRGACAAWWWARTPA